jgi:3-dehydroquinate synthetase
MDTVQDILSFLLSKRAVRISKVYIKGGGLLLDLAGFACSIYMRGID